MSAVGTSTTAQIFTVSANAAHSNDVATDTEVHERQRFKVSRVKFKSSS